MSVCDPVRMSRRLVVRSALVALAMLSAAPVTAHAVTVKLASVCLYPNECSGFATVEDPDGRSNRLRISGAGRTLTVTDRAAVPTVVTTGPPREATCMTTGHTVSCTLPDVPDNLFPMSLQTSVDAGAGNDRVELAGEPRHISIAGGRGDDVIVNDNLPESKPPTRHCPDVGVTMSGGPGNDRMSGATRFVVSPGRDVLRSPSPQCALDAAGWDVDMQKGIARRATNRTTFNRLTPVRVGAGVLRGTNRADRLSGSNVIEGLGGNDSIGIFPNPNGKHGTQTRRVSAGSGDDTISVAGTLRSLSCGPGADNVKLYDYGAGVTAMEPDCELVDPGLGWSVDARPRLTPGSVDVTVHCHRPDGCTGAVAITGLSAPAAFSTADGTNHIVHVPRVAGTPRLTARRIRLSLSGAFGPGPIWAISPKR